MANDKKFITKNGLKTQNIAFVEDVGSSSVTDSINASIANNILTFSGPSVPELFKISDTLNDTIFSVNDELGVALFETDEDGTIRMGEFVGNVLIGTNTDDGSNKLQVSGNVAISDSLSVVGNIAVTGTVDGRDVATDGTKLDTIESGATADLTGAEIRTLLEAEANTNIFSDSDASKLAGIENGADVTDATNVAAAGALMTTGGTMSANLNFNDNVWANFGTGQDFHVYHDGTTNYIVGDEHPLVIRGDNSVTLKINNNTRTVFVSDIAVNAGGPKLYANNLERLAVTPSGITVSGTTTTDTLSVVGGVTIDTNTLYVNSTTNRVGIGTASPGYALDVKFAANFQNDILVSGTVDGRDLATDGAKLDLINQGLATTDSPTFVTLNATTVDLGDWTITETSGSLAFSASGVTKMLLHSNGHLQVSGNVEALATL